MYIPEYVYKNPACAHECGFLSAFKAYDLTTLKLLPAVYTFVPDWNDTWLQSRARALLVALRAALDAESIPIAWIDVGLYGQYGEWYVRPTYYLGPPQGNVPTGVSDASLASREAYAMMHFEVFPEAQHLMFAKLDQLSALSWGLSQSTTQKPIGLRTDCLGKTTTLGEWDSNPSSFALIKDQWKKAPFIAEFCSPDTGKNIIDISMASDQIKRFHISTIGNGQIAPKASTDINARWAALTNDEQNALIKLGREVGYRYFIAESGVSLSTDGSLRVRAVLRNGGTAPSYDDWRLTLDLLDASGSIVATQPITLSLQDNTGTCSSQVIDVNWSPAVTSTGTFTLKLSAKHSYWPMLRFVNSDRNSDGSVTLASLQRK